MQLLVLSPWFPYPADNGSRLRAYHLIRHLALRGHRIRLVTGVQDDRQEAVAQGIPTELKELAAEIELAPWKWYQGEQGGMQDLLKAMLSTVPRSIRETPNPEMQAAIARQLQKPTDIVLAMQLGMDAYIPALPPNVPLVMDEVEVSGVERAFRQSAGAKDYIRNGLTYQKSVHYWRTRLRRYQALTTVSAEEAEAVRKVVGGDGPGHPAVSVVPNGVDVAAFPKAPSANRVPGRMLYNGALSYGPNRDAVYWFVKEMLPLIGEAVPEAHLLVTGRSDPNEHPLLRDHPKVHLTGFLDDLRPTLAESSVAVVPLLAGGGTRLKILEAWAAHLPVVATSVGAVGLGGVSGENILLADSPKEFATATIRLLSQPEEAAGIADRARRAAEQRFDWLAISGLLEQVLQETAISLR